MHKRIAPLLALVAALALALASVAWAVISGFSGSLEHKGTVAFKLEKPDEGGQYLVKGWKWDNLRIRCRNGKHRYDGKFKGLDMKVDQKGAFWQKAVNPEFGGRAIVHGQFDAEYVGAQGTLKIRGRTVWGRHCRSGEVDWTAREIPPPQ